MRLWYPVAGPKLVASLSKTDFGLPENESKITLLLLAAFPGWPQHGADSEGGGAVFGLLIPVLAPPALRQPSTCAKNTGTVVTATPTCPLSFVPAVCNPETKSGSLCRFQYIQGCDISICTFITGLTELQFHEKTRG